MVGEGRAAGGVLDDYRLVIGIILGIPRGHGLTHTKLGAELRGEIAVSGLKLVNTNRSANIGNIHKVAHDKTVGHNIHVIIRHLVILTEIINKRLSTCA